MAAKPTLAEVNKLLWQLIIPFHEIERDMPLPISSRRNDNDAEHSWSLALLACSLAQRVDPTLDTGKVCQFAVVHDLVEIYAGDVSLWGKEEDLANKAIREEEAVKKIGQEFAAFPWIADTIVEYEERHSPESLFVYAADKYLNLLVRSTDSGEYFKNKMVSKEMFRKRIADHRKKAHRHPGIGKLYDELLETFDKKVGFFYEAKL